MRLEQLAGSGRAPILPLNLTLAGDELRVERWLRVLPGQRYVGLAQWRGRAVLAKLLVGGKAERHFRRELDGARLLAEQALLTPELLAEGFVQGQGGWLLFDYLDGARSLWDAWREVAGEAPLSVAQQAVLGEALTAIAQMHGKGLWQADLHLDNLLRHDGRLYLIDGGGVRGETPGQPLSRARVLENLGVFFAQLPAELAPFTEELLIHYLLANGEHALPLEALLKEVEKVRRWRLRDYLRKVGRDCSLFAAKVGAFGLRVVRRECAAELQPLLDAPDAVLADGQALKRGGSATVARIELGGRALVVKRYNLKGLGHWLRRFWRPSRAWHSWREGHRLELLGIATPRPLAVLERRWCWLRGRAYLITEYCGGQDIIARFQAHLQGSPPENELLALDRLFAALLRERISHGDFKGHNLFWDDERGAWSLIDLDAMQQHRSARGFARAYARDRARFLRNWPADCALHQLLDQRLPQVPGTCPN
ncbi:serine/threonine protein kinase [Pseudomonas sp. AOB-7]|uniref:lipopolysaccharide kinase InaA family protein n=1 Tax=Pseudomonas sp. AOB-7 TaxID=2482750 RepID=UPI000EFD5F37|nr:lipopolysaccharide kinase InaA family protein [Pseudomonas sp. AOB-7]RMH83686.1 serine/threonine protein kinase [Pseudomonas sp. AOB-7]